MMTIDEKSTFYIPKYKQYKRDGLYVLIDPASPHWIATDNRGARILNYLNGKNSVSNLTRNYLREFRLSNVIAWLHISSFLRETRRTNFISTQKLSRTSPYTGRQDYLNLNELEELWFHTNNSCNLSCAHCLVSSSPKGDKGLCTNKLKEVIDEALRLGVKRFYFTGGEPFLRKDIFGLIDYVTQRAELIILTNGTLLEGEILEKLSKYDPKRLKLQISLDGSNPKINDPLRGKGSFKTISRGIKKAASLGILSSVTTVVTAKNLEDLPHITELVARLGGKIHHLLWLHPRGRAQDGTLSASAHKIIKILPKILKKAKSLGVVIDNFESIKLRVGRGPGVKIDLSNACYSSLCLYSDGRIFPSAGLAGIDRFSCGNVANESLENIWRHSKVCHEIRSQTVEKKASCRKCQLKFICGGGDTDYSLSGKDPYCSVYKYFIEEALFELARTGKRYFNTRSGYNSPVIYHAMGENSINCSSGSKKIFKNNLSVDTVHSNCVLSFEMDKPRETVRQFYSKAAEEPQDGLCCPSTYPGDETAHIPQEAIDRFYGCGGPISLAEVKEKETVVDLGSGAGIDCFIAAKKVGRRGWVIGIDMTDEMLSVANKNKAIVAENLGYNVVEFKKGYLEEIPIESKSVDLVTSNCVINLSPDKRKVFSEIWRILKDSGRLLVSDIVSDTKLPPHLKANPHLWGECLAGALTEEEFLTYLEQGGFYGITILKKEYWKEVEGFKFYSITLRGYKFEKTKGCIYQGQKATYQGPFKVVVDEEGHLFSRGEEIEVCTDTAAKLKNYPYCRQFTIVQPDGTRTGGEVPCCGPEGDPC